MSSTPVPSSKRRAVLSALIIVLPLAPSLLLAPLGLDAAAGAYCLGAMAGLLAIMLTSRRSTALIVLVAAVANGLAVVVAHSPVGAGLLMLTVAAAYGLSARRGVTGAIVLVPISVGFTLATPPSVVTPTGGLSNAAIVAAVTLGGAVWGIVIGLLLSKGRHLPPADAMSWPSTQRFVVIIGVVTGATAAAIVAWHLQHGGAWILVTLFGVIQPSVQQSLSKTIHRAIGTGVGFLIALVIAWLIPWAPVAFTLGLVFLGAAIYIKLDSRRPYWEFVTLLTPGIVLVEGSSSDVLTTDLQRLFFTLVGVAVALVLIVVAEVAYGARDRHTASAHS